MDLSAPALRRTLLRAALPLLLLAPAARGEDPLAVELHEEVVRIPMAVERGQGTKEVALTATVYRPDGAGPFPLVVLSHGSPGTAAGRARLGRWRLLPQIRALVRRGLAVVVPMRRGYGATGGDFAEGYGRCAAADFGAAGAEAARDVLGAVRWAVAQPWADRKAVLLVGQSAGGFASLAAASEAPPGVVGVVSFAGGRGGQPETHPGDPCSPALMAATLRRWAQTTRVPALWVYAENDRRFGPVHVRAWFEAFREGGGTGRLVMLPPFGKDGHKLFSAAAGIPLWTPQLDGFLSALGLAARVGPGD